MKTPARKDGAGRRTENTAIKVPLYPTAEQAELIDKTFGCCRYLWNQMLLDEQEFYAAADRHFIPTPARYKAEAPFLKEVDSQALCGVHQNLRQAFQRFFRRPEQYRHPTLQRKKARQDRYTTYCQYFPSGPTVYLTEDGVRLPKLGVVRAKLYRKPLHWWTLKAATISKTPSGRYFCALRYEYTVQIPEPAAPAPEKVLGLHASPAHFYVDSQGTAADPPRWLRQSQARLAQLQRRLARMERGSKHYAAQLGRIQRLHEHIANQRRDFVHKESRRIANAWDAVCVRATDLTAMAGQRPLGRYLEPGFGQFRVCLAYKLARQGKAYIAIDPRRPVVKTCHACGGVNEGLTPRERVWRCPHCGAELARERNAAENIREQGMAGLRIA